MTTSTAPQFSPAQDYSLMMRQALIRQAQDRISALASSIQGAQLPEGWAGSAADAFIAGFRGRHLELATPLIDLETAERIVSDWRQG